MFDAANNKKIIREVLKKHNIRPIKVEIGESEYPDEKGEYHVFIRAKNRMSFKEGYELQKNIENEIREKLGENFFVMFVPELTD